ncbi:hypothetical protein Y032_0498g2538 [Ancylostoma ceylanicum]|uniref:Uncharacterized protein n=1 Tax=Ancylostoma ceylanicum TaxID=53326 RepID=A0A016WUL0_9BILA|nr:hypothetical protein Y032_0498g2538 [Ancylostoma ceylanicum]
MFELSIIPSLSIISSMKLFIKPKKSCKSLLFPHILLKSFLSSANAYDLSRSAVASLLSLFRCQPFATVVGGALKQSKTL